MGILAMGCFASSKTLGTISDFPKVTTSGGDVIGLETALIERRNEEREYKSRTENFTDHRRSCFVDCERAEPMIQCFVGAILF